VFVIEEEFYTLDLVKANPDKIYLFGDNLAERGYRGQACIRDLPNSLGIPTKRLPCRSNNCYFSDTVDEMDAVLNALTIMYRLHQKGETIVLPKDGLGTGLAELTERSPNIYSYLTGNLQQYCPEYLR